MKVSNTMKAVLQKAEALERAGRTISTAYHGVTYASLDALVKRGLLERTERFFIYRLTPAGKAWLAESGETR